MTAVVKYISPQSITAQAEALEAAVANPSGTPAP